MKYPRRPGSDDSGRDYETKITALLALRCATAKDTQDMWVGSNVDQVGDFDDAVLFKQTNEGVRTAYLIQLKHQESPKNINPSDFAHVIKNKGKRKKSKEDFALAKYLASFLEFKRSISESKEDFVECLRQATVVFVLFTNRGVGECDFLEKNCDTSLCFLNTCYNNKDNIYKFSDKLGYDSDFLRQLVLFSNQTHLNDVDGLIQSEIKKLMGSCKLTNEELKSAGDKFTAFVRTWAKSTESDALTKSDIINKICDALLDPYRFEFSKYAFRSYECATKSAWNEIVNNMQVTIVDYEDSVVEFLTQYLGTEIRKYCEGTTVWADCLTKQAQNLLTKHELRYAKGTKVTLFDVYKLLWLMQKLPLLLQISAADCQNIAQILKVLNYNLRVIVIKDQATELALKHVKCFANLNDLSPQDRSAILNQAVKLQGRASVVLTDIIDGSLYKFIKCGDIIKILSGDFSIGPEYQALPKYFIQRGLSKILLKTEVLEQVDEMFLIDGVPNFSRVAKPNQLNATHEVQYHDEHSLEWKQSHGSIKNIQPYKSDEKIWVLQVNRPVNILSAGPGMGKSIFMNYIARQAPANIWVLKINLNDHDDYYEKKRKRAKASDHLKYFNDSILQTDSNENLSKAVFQKLLGLKQILVLLDGFDEVSVTYKREVTEIAKQVYEEGLGMWITTRPVMKMHLEDEFNTFSLSLKPFTMDDQESFLCRYFSELHKSDCGSILEFVQKLLQAARVNLKDKDSEFTGVPLQTKLLADVFSNECRACITSGIIQLREKFDLLYLYNEFIKNKTDILCAKFGKGVKQMRILFEKHQQLFALKILFHRDDLSGLNIDKELDEYYEDKQCKIQFLQREGVVVVHRNNTNEICSTQSEPSLPKNEPSRPKDESSFPKDEPSLTICKSNVQTEKKHKFYIRFVHRTFAEYLAAQWLAENFDNEDLEDTIQVLMKKRFPPFKLHPFLFNMFDRMLAVDCRLHSAIINGQLDEAEAHIPECLDSVDDAGRTVLHIVALNGTYHPHQALLNISIEDKMVKVLELIPADSQIVDVQDDVGGYNALDYAIMNYSLAVADKLCEKFHSLTINTYITEREQQQLFAYCSWLNYRSLFKTLLPYSATKGLILPFANKTIEVQSLYEEIAETNGFVMTMDQDHQYGDLHFAVAFGTDSNVLNLLERGRNINRLDFQMNTPLHYAVIRNRLETTRLLIKHGADINKLGKHLNTALHYAAESGANDIVTELIKNGADINCTNTNNDVPLHCAILGGHSDTVKLLLSKCANADVTNEMGDSTLHLAAKFSYDDVVLDLLQNGAEIDKTNLFGETPLHLAFYEENISTAKLLLSKGASLSHQDSNGNSAMHFAAMNEDTDIIAEMLSKGADINQQNKNGDTPLNCALLTRKIDTAAFLLANEAHTNINKEGTTTLHYAAHAGADDLILKPSESDINAVNNEGDTPLHFAIKRNQVSTIKLLLANGAVTMENKSQNTTLHYAVKLDNFDIISTLVQSSDVTKANNEGDTPLHVAVQKGNPAVVDLLITTATINKQNKHGKTPLHTAIGDQDCFTKENFENQKSVVYLLLDKGANVNMQDFKGNTALHHACTDHFTERVTLIMTQERKFGMIGFYEATVKLLLAKGAKTDVKNDEKKTVLDLATEAEYSSIIDLLQGPTA